MTNKAYNEYLHSLYRYPYYLGVGHSTNLRNHTGHTRRVYRAHLILLTAEPEFRVVFVSDPLKVHSTIYQMFRGKRFWNIVEDRYVTLRMFASLHLKVHILQ